MRCIACQMLGRVDKDQLSPALAIMCNLSIEWCIMSKHCTSLDFVFEDETD